MSFPVPFYVIDHPDGVAVFDCGLHRGMMEEGDRYRAALVAQGMEVRLSSSQTITERLRALDIDPARVRYAILSHLHFDHAGGLSDLPNADVIVQAREWAAGFDDEEGARYFLPRAYFDLGHTVCQIDGEYDLFGDGSTVCLPSFGHTPGHQSLRVRSQAGDHILTADACYFCQILESRRFPAFADPQASNRSLDALLALREPETVMVLGHDPTQWGEKSVLPQRR